MEGHIPSREGGDTLLPSILAGQRKEGYHHGTEEGGIPSWDRGRRDTIMGQRKEG